MPNQHTRLQQQLARQQQNYLALEPPGGSTARLRFPGRFQGRDIVWDATLLTLQARYTQLLHQRQVLAGQNSSLRQSIHIQHSDSELIPIEIALDVPRIDHPTILKSMIMVHNYRNLQPGRHEFGPTVSFPSTQEPPQG